MGSNGKPLKRLDIGSELPEVCTLPNLIGIQTESYKKFLQLDRLEKGLEPDPAYGLEHTPSIIVAKDEFLCHYLRAGNEASFLFIIPWRKQNQNKHQQICQHEQRYY